MTNPSTFDSWSAGNNYDLYMGRWSRSMAQKFITWLAPDTGADWLEIGFGTGALTQTIIEQCDPASILGIDTSHDFVDNIRHNVHNLRARFYIGQVEKLDLDDASVDVTTSALVMNFLPDQQAAIGELKRVLRPGGVFCYYIWDYPSRGIELVDRFWKAAAEIVPEARALDEAARYGFCTRNGIADTLATAGLTSPEIVSLNIETRFADFDAYWHPFMLGTGPAPGFLATLDADQQSAIRQTLAAQLGETGEITLNARAWGVRARL